ncbi:MAG: NAD(P)-dependent oxidoreductase [Limosilactobacillus sp.]|uniref:NAD(P)-dependent oxidoreductase n=1 Tax=Limosilactobacillus sp. TaxID=2773925 RepID=UPI002709A633|nr:NAD(P)-dependent oxidoreductase [Limosilactobacillus sp.]
MTKILVANVREWELSDIKTFEKEHEIEVITTPKNLEDSTELLADVDGVAIQQRQPLDPGIYAKLKENGIKQIASRTAGYDMIDVEKAHENGLVVTNVPAYSPRSVAEHALTQIFRMLRKSYLIDARAANCDFGWYPDEQATEIHTATIGVIGVGRIGGALAKMLHALGAEVLGYDVKPREEMKGIVEYVSKEELLTRSDVVSLHVNLNPTSEKLITKEDFALMKPTAALVNASRGPVVVTEDLVDALEKKEIAAAALDTFVGENEIVPKDLSNTGLGDFPLIDKLHKMYNVYLTPHIAFFTNMAIKNMVDISLTDILTILDGKKSEHELER